MRQAVAALAFAVSLVATARAAGSFEASLGGLNPLRASLTVTDGDAPKPLTKIVSHAGQITGVVEAADGRFLTVRLDQPASGVRLGDALHFETAGSGSPKPAAIAEPAPEATVSRLDGTQVYVAGPRPNPTLPAEVRHESRLVGRVVWLGDGDAKLGWRGTWRPATDGERPMLGDAVVYVAAPAPPAPPDTHPKATRGPTPAGQDDMVSGDDPDMRVLSLLASRGYLSGNGRRQFEGRGVFTFTRHEIADVLAEAVGKILDANHVWPIQTIGPGLAAQLLGLFRAYRGEMMSHGVPVAAAEAILDRMAGQGWSWQASADVDARLSAGKQASTGRVRGSLFAAEGQRLRMSATVGTEGVAAFPNDHRRSALETAWLEYAPSRHLTLGAGRTSWRLGPGYHDMLWSDDARPLDGFMVNWRTQVFGRPLEFSQHFGYFGDNGDHYVTVRRFAWQPLRQLTVAANEALITDRMAQGLATNVMPLYLARFVSGPQGGGGHGNYLGSLEAAWRFNDQLSWYGELLVDDFDFSPSPPKTVQRLGWLAGVHYNPRGARPGTSYRLEGAILPNPGTYTGQSDPGLQWQRGNFMLGHPYGEDAAGYRFSARHRLSSSFDVSFNLEQFHQFRRRPVELRTSLAELSLGYDLLPNVSLGVGASYNHRSNIGGLMGNNANETAFFLETRAGY